MKTCTKCKQSKPFTDFYVNKVYRDGLQYWCKTCRLAYERIRHNANPDRARHNVAKRKYGISLVERQNMFDAQGEVRKMLYPVI